MSAAPLVYHLTDEAREDLRQAIAAPLRRYNDSQAGPSGYRALVISLTRGGEALGGLWGYTSYGWLYVQLLAVEEAARGQGAGRELLRRAEAEALARGCHGAWLDTHEFQAAASTNAWATRCSASWRTIRRALRGTSCARRWVDRPASEGPCTLSYFRRWVW